MEPRYYSFNNYLRANFGERVHRIGLDAGFTCPNLDGTLSKDGCSYCNNKAFTVHSRKTKDLDEQIKQSIEFYSRRLGVKKFVAYFQAFTNTWAPIDELRVAYDVIRKYPQIIGLFISTRPDCINKEKIEMISEYKRDYLVWLEYGLGTTDDAILSSVNRNHAYKDFLSALDLTRSYNINTCIHIIFGLPKSTNNSMAEDINKIAKLDIQGIKFHVFHVLKGTDFEKAYSKNKFCLLGKDEYIKTVCDCLERIQKNVVVMRLVSTASKLFLIAPDWINDKHFVIEAINNELRLRETYQGSYYESIAHKSI